MESVPLEDVIHTAELHRRPDRPRDFLLEYDTLQGFAKRLAARTTAVLDEVVAAAVRICRAESSGISIPSIENGTPVLRWQAVAGIYADRLSQTVPLCSPCGHVLRHGRAELFQYPSRAFPELAAVEPPIAEVLIVPLTAATAVLGTLWTETHTEVGRFTAADLHVLTMLSDFTAAALMLKTREQEALEAARRERTERERAELANRQKDEFLSTVSHELRTPLHAILSWSELLLDDLGEPDRLEAVTSIHRNALRQAELVEDLLDSASASNSTPPAETDVIELSGLIEDVLDHLASQARAKTIDIRTRLRTNILVDGQRGRLEQAVTNVLSNAIKFTEPGGSVRIELGVADREAEITVADSGIGIAADFLPFVFDRFRQADSSARRRHRGLGLGLALTRDFIHAHGGRVTVLSDGVGYGSRFTIALPLSQTGAITKSQRETTAPERPPLSGLRVLVVDDDADSRNSLAAVLTRAGAIVTAADSVRAALAAAIQAPPELVLTDIAIPVEDGYKMLECLRRDVDPKGSIPVIGITAYGSVATRERMNRAGFTDVIIKPVTARLLVDLVAGHVDRG